MIRSLDDGPSEALNLRAALAGRTAEGEHGAILGQVLLPEAESLAETAAQLRARTARQTTDSADLIRQDRDRDSTE